MNTIDLENAFEARTYARFPDIFVRGENHLLFSESGESFIDLYGGHCVTILGHSHPAIAEALYKQARELMFYSNVTYSPIRAQASQKLVEMAPDGFNKVFYCNSGAEANENALKIAWKITGKSRIVSTFGAFHGRTNGALSATHSEKLRLPYEFGLAPAEFVPFGDSEAFEQLAQEYDDIAAFIVEPIQSMAGINFAPTEYYQKLRNLCDENDILLIFDEIQTGVGRTGTFSICESLGMEPDLITLAKSLGNGFPVGAVLMPDRLAEFLEIGDLGSTFAGGMLASAAVLTTLQEIESNQLMQKATAIFDRLQAGLKDMPIQVKGRGALIGLEFQEPVQEIKSRLYKHKYLVGGANHPNVLRLMPPLTTPLEVIDEFITNLKRAIA